jgi:hypothetical protein
MNKNYFFENLLNLNLVDSNTYILIEFQKMESSLITEIINSSELKELHPSLLFSMMLMVQNSGLDNTFLISIYSYMVDRIK